MYVINMESDKTLVTTVHATIYQGDTNADVMTFLVPLEYDGTSIADCAMLLRYILPDGSGVSEELEMYPLPYSTSYYQYKLPIGSRLTAKAGDIELWLTAMDTAESVLFRTSSATVTISKAKNIEDYMSDGERDQLTKLASRIDALQKGKADSLSYDSSTRKLNLTAQGAAIGESVTVPADDYDGGGSGDETWEDMTDNEESDTSGSEEWEPM